MINVKNADNNQAATLNNSTATRGPQGERGYLYTPTITNNVLSFTNDGGLPNPPATDLAAPINPVKNEVEAARGTYANLDQRLDSHDTALANLVTQDNALDARLDVAEPKITALQSDMTAEKAKITSLQSDMATEKPKITSLQSDMTAEKAKIVTLQADNNVNKTNIATLQSGKADKLTATNLVTNGDFSNGTTGWSPNAVTLTASANKLVSTVKSTFTGGNPSTAISGGVQSTNKYYAYVRMKPTSGTPVYIQARLRANSPVESHIFGLKYNPVVNTTYTLSTVYTMSVTSATADIYLDHFYADASSAFGQTCEMQYVQVINLTATFGAGNEPTLAEMDLLMSQFSNSWFDGTQELLSLKGVQKELSSKASIAQEAWITPTLTNGATGTARYRKDTLGGVHLDLDIANVTSTLAVLTLPVGYRPKNNVWINARGPAPSTNATGYILQSGSVIFTANYASLYTTMYFPMV